MDELDVSLRSTLGVRDGERDFYLEIRIKDLHFINLHEGVPWSGNSRNKGLNPLVHRIHLRYERSLTGRREFI